MKAKYVQVGEEVKIKIRAAAIRPRLPWACHNTATQTEGGRWGIATSGRNVHKAWAGRVTTGCSIIPTEPQSCLTHPSKWHRCPETRQMKTRPHFSPYSHMGASREDWPTEEAMGGPLVEWLGGCADVETRKGEYS